MVNLTAFSKIGLNGSCKFFNENDELIFNCTTENKDGYVVVSVFDKKNEKIACIEHKDSKKYTIGKFMNLRINELILDLGGNKFNFKVNKKNKLICDALNLEVKRGILDKSFKVYKEDKCLLSARTFTMGKDYLSAKYNIKIEDTENLSLYVCICIMIFIIIFDGATYVTSYNLLR